MTTFHSRNFRDFLCHVRSVCWLFCHPLPSSPIPLTVSPFPFPPLPLMQSHPSPFFAPFFPFVVLDENGTMPVLQELVDGEMF